MSDLHQPGTTEESLEALRDIKRMMERSSRFISLSGLSGVSAGVCALAGAWIASGWLQTYYEAGDANNIFLTARGLEEGHSLRERLMLLALGVLAAALLSSTWFTWRRARKNHLPVWDLTSKKLAVNMAIPLVTGGLFLLGLYAHSHWEIIAPASLVFYGLALVNASKYTHNEIRALGILEILLGTVNLYFAQWGLWFWAMGFGILHIVYGLIMWWKYEK